MWALLALLSHRRLQRPHIPLDLRRDLILRHVQVVPRLQVRPERSGKGPFECTPKVPLLDKLTLPCYDFS